MKLLMVCLGNICRSPLAQAVMEKMVENRGLDIYVDSAGTAGYHVGTKPDPRSIQVGQSKGYRFDGQQCRQVSQDDFETFDKILAMDRANLTDLKRICPAEHQHKLSLILDFAHCAEQEVPDPYYGHEDGFMHVLNLVEQGCEALLEHLSKL